MFYTAELIDTYSDYNEIKVVEKLRAASNYFNCSMYDLDFDEKRNILNYENKEYLLLSEREAEEIFRDIMFEIIEGSICDLPKFAQRYFDYERYIKDVYLEQGYGGILAAYDGYQIDLPAIDKNDYFLYRI